MNIVYMRLLLLMLSTHFPMWAISSVEKIGELNGKVAPETKRAFIWNVSCVVCILNYAHTSTHHKQYNQKFLLFPPEMYGNSSECSSLSELLFILLFVNSIHLLVAVHELEDDDGWWSMADDDCYARNSKTIPMFISELFIYTLFGCCFRVRVIASIVFLLYRICLAKR